MSFLQSKTAFGGWSESRHCAGNRSGLKNILIFLIFILAY